MSGSWCMWCLMSPQEWKLPTTEVPLAHKENRTIDKLKAAHLRNINNGLKDPQNIRGVVDFPIWDFIPVSNYVYPVLHGQIGLVNDAVDLFYVILDDNAEVMSDVEKTTRNNYIVAEIALENSREILKRWKEMQSIDLEFYDVLRKDISNALKQRGLSDVEQNRLKEEKKK
jgi:hypothetical protein